MGKLNTLKRGDHFLWSDGKLYTVDHQDSEVTYVTDQNGEGHLFSGSLEVRRYTLLDHAAHRKLINECSRVAAKEGDYDSMKKYMDQMDEMGLIAVIGENPNDERGTYARKTLSNLGFDEEWIEEQLTVYHVCQGVYSVASTWNALHKNAGL